MGADVPERASVVVVGGGVVGTSAAFHLAEGGVDDVLSLHRVGYLFLLEHPEHVQALGSATAARRHSATLVPHCAR